jgi:hypothetical protein
VFVLVEQGSGLAFGLGDGGVGDAEQLGEDASGQPETGAQDGGEQHLGQGERGWVSPGG